MFSIEKENKVVNERVEYDWNVENRIRERIVIVIHQDVGIINYIIVIKFNKSVASTYKS